MITTGSKAQVWHGSAKHTPGGLTKAHLMRTKHGRIVSKKQHAHGLKMYRKMSARNKSIFKSNQDKVKRKHSKKSRRTRLRSRK
jgi:hypothetical protein